MPAHPARPRDPRIVAISIGLVAVLATLAVLGFNVLVPEAADSPPTVGLAEAGDRTLHVVGTLGEGGASAALEVWLAPAAGIGRRTQGSGATWLDVDCRDRTATERRHATELEYQVARVYLDPDDCVAHAGDLIVAIDRRLAAGELETTGETEVDGRRALEVRSPDDPTAATWLIDARTRLLLRATFRERPPIRITYELTELVDAPPPTFSGAWNPSSRERYVELPIVAALDASLDRLGAELPPTILEHDLAEALSVERSGARPDASTILLVYRAGTSEIQVEVLEAPLAEVEFGLGLDGVRFAANVGTGAVLVFAEDPELQEQAVDALELERG
jgi:hypothetical protein